MILRSRNGAGKENPETKGETENYILLAYGKVASPLHHPNLNRIEEFVVDSGASMHMNSKKDLNSAELETAMEKCRRMKRQPSTSKNWIHSWPWKSSRIRQQCCRSEGFVREIADIHMSGPVVRNHVSSNMVFGFNVIRKTTYRSWSQSHQRLLLRQAHLVQHLQHHYRRNVQVKNQFQQQLNVRMQTNKTRWDLSSDPIKILKPNKDVHHEQVRNDPYFSERSTWIAARIQRESCGWKSSRTGRLTREFSWTLFRAAETRGTRQSQCLHTLPERPKLRDLSEDQNYKSFFTRAPCRRRTGEVAHPWTNWKTCYVTSKEALRSWDLTFTRTRQKFSATKRIKDKKEWKSTTSRSKCWKKKRVPSTLDRKNRLNNKRQPKQTTEYDQRGQHSTNSDRNWHRNRTAGATVVTPTLTYACATWTLTKDDILGIQIQMKNEMPTDLDDIEDLLTKHDTFKLLNDDDTLGLFKGHVPQNGDILGKNEMPAGLTQLHESGRGLRGHLSGACCSEGGGDWQFHDDDRDQTEPAGWHRSWGGELEG